MSLQGLTTDLLALESAFDDFKARYPQIARDAATARINYELDYGDELDKIAHEIILQQQIDPKYKPNADEKAAMATKRTADQYRQYRETEAERDGMGKVIAVLQSQLTSVQTRTKLELIEKGLIDAQI